MKKAFVAIYIFLTIQTLGQTDTSSCPNYIKLSYNGDLNHPIYSRIFYFSSKYQPHWDSNPFINYTLLDRTSYNILDSIICRKAIFKDSAIQFSYNYPIFPFSIYSNGSLSLYYVVYRKNKEVEILKDIINELTIKKCSKNLIRELNEFIGELDCIPKYYERRDK